VERLDHQAVASDAWQNLDEIVLVLDQDLAEEIDYLRAVVAFRKATVDVGQLGDELQRRITAYASEGDDQ